MFKFKQILKSRLVENFKRKLLHYILRIFNHFVKLPIYFFGSVNDGPSFLALHLSKKYGGDKGTL